MLGEGGGGGWGGVGGGSIQKILNKYVNHICGQVPGSGVVPSHLLPPPTHGGMSKFYGTMYEKQSSLPLGKIDLSMVEQYLFQTQRPSKLINSSCTCKIILTNEEEKSIFALLYITPDENHYKPHCSLKEITIKVFRCGSST